MQSKRNIPLLHIIALCRSLIFAYVIERLFWQSRGMSIGMVVACEAIYALVVIALEVPSGVLADRLGRKHLMIVFAITGFGEMAILLFAQRFWHFAAAICVAGVGRAAASGAENAMLYDTLAEGGGEDRFARVLGRLRALDGAGGMAAALCGSLLAERFGLSVPYQLSLVSYALMTAATLLLREPKRSFATEARASARDILRGAASFFRRRPEVLLVTIRATVVAAFMIYIDEFWQLYLEGVGTPVALFGVVAALYALARIAGDLLGGRLAGRPRVGSLLTGLTMVVAAAFLAAGVWKSPAGLAVTLVAAAAANALQVIAAGYLHRRVDDGARATIESVGSILERVAVLPVGVVFAWVADTQSLFCAYTVLSGCCFAITLVFWLLDRR